MKTTNFLQFAILLMALTTTSCNHEDLFPFNGGNGDDRTEVCNGLELESKTNASIIAEVFEENEFEIDISSPDLSPESGKMTVMLFTNTYNRRNRPAHVPQRVVAGGFPFIDGASVDGSQIWYIGQNSDPVTFDGNLDNARTAIFSTEPIVIEGQNVPFDMELIILENPDFTIPLEDNVVSQRVPVYVTTADDRLKRWRRTRIIPFPSTTTMGPKTLYMAMIKNCE